MTAVTQTMPWPKLYECDRCGGNIGWLGYWWHTWADDAARCKGPKRDPRD